MKSLTKLHRKYCLFKPLQKNTPLEVYLQKWFKILNKYLNTITPNTQTFVTEIRQIRFHVLFFFLPFPYFYAVVCNVFKFWYCPSEKSSLIVKHLLLKTMQVCTITITTNENMLAKVNAGCTAKKTNDFIIINNPLQWKQMNLQYVLNKLFN